MPIQGSQWNSFSAWGNGYHTMQINIEPAWASAEASLFGTTGGGTQYAGIKHYRKRLNSGLDEEHEFGDWPSWPPAIFDFISSVTFAIATGPSQQGWLLSRIDFWG